MYTWGYIKECTLMKMDLSEKDAANYDFVNRFPFYANEAMTQICSSVKPNRTFAEFDINDENIKKLQEMPSDFVSFGDDVNQIEYNYRGEIVVEPADSSCFEYVGYNKIKFHRAGKYKISYNARWIVFSSVMDNNCVLNVPADVLDCIPSYIAHQCYKIDDEYKSSVFRNEYEMFLSRIDNTDFKTPKSIRIEGDW